MADGDAEIIKRVDEGEEVVIGSYSVKVKNKEEDSSGNKRPSVRVTFTTEGEQTFRSAVFSIYYEDPESKELIASAVFDGIDEVERRANSLMNFRDGVLFFITCLRQEDLDMFSLDFAVDDEISRKMVNLPESWNRRVAA